MDIMGTAASSAAGGRAVTKQPKAKPIAEIDTELKVIIRSAMRVCDEAQDARLMVRYLLEQALMALEHISSQEAQSFRH
jgi:hypothetical protein